LPLVTPAKTATRLALIGRWTADYRSALMRRARSPPLRHGSTLRKRGRVPEITLGMGDFVLPAAAGHGNGLPFLGPGVDAVGADRLERVWNRDEHFVLVQHLVEGFRIGLQVAGGVDPEDLGRRARDGEECGPQRRQARILEADQLGAGIDPHVA